MMINFRKFKEKDIENKVNWINDPLVNKYLHYDLPLDIDKTKQWYEKNKNNKQRYDAVIEYGAEPIGLLGFLNIENGSAEYYITLGNSKYFGKGIAKKASLLAFEFAKNKLKINNLYVYIEVGNESSKNLFEKLDFKFEKTIKNHTTNKGISVDSLFYKKRLVNDYNE